MSARRLSSFKRGEAFEIQVDGQRVQAFKGETIATVLMAAGIRCFHRDPQTGTTHNLSCGVGVCMQCLTKVNGEFCQACRTLAFPGMKVETLT